METVATLGRDEMEALLRNLLARTGTSLDAALLLAKHEQEPAAASEDDTPAWLVDATRQLHELKAEEPKAHEQPTGGHTMQLTLEKPAQQCRLGLRLQYFEGVVLVLAVQPDSHAAAAGLRYLSLPLEPWSMVAGGAKACA